MKRKSRRQEYKDTADEKRRTVIGVS